MKNKDTSGTAPSSWRSWLISGVLLCAAMLALRHFAPLFRYDVKVTDMPVIPLVLLYCFSSLLFYLFLPGLIRKTPTSSTKNIVLFVVLSGIAMRLMAIGTPAVLEDDYNRYLWDGAVTASGENPFRYSPDQIFDKPELNSKLTELSEQAHQIFDRINHPQFSTVYPPVAQGAFSVAHFISPFSLDAWRFLLIIFELACLGFIFGILRELGRSPLWLSIYWWNPVILKEISNSAHMEPVLILPVLAAAYLVLKRKPIWVSTFLAIGAGVKVWPALLTAAIWRQMLTKPKALIASTMIFLSFLAIFLWPVLTSGVNETSGFVAFGSQWNSSSAIYLVSEWLASAIIPASIADTLKPPLIARAFLGIMLLLVISITCFHKAKNEKEILYRIFLMIAVIYILAPSQTPWYFIWIAPFLCFYPVRGLLLAGVLIPLHYSFFYLSARGMEDIYQHGIVWMIWLPVWGLLLYDIIKRYQAGQATQGENHAAG